MASHWRAVMCLVFFVALILVDPSHAQEPQTPGDSPKSKVDDQLCADIDAAELEKLITTTYTGGGMVFESLQSFFRDGLVYQAPTDVKAILSSQKAMLTIIGDLKVGKSYITFHITNVDGPSFACFPTRGIQVVCSKDLKSCLADTEGRGDFRYGNASEIFTLAAATHLSAEGGAVIFVTPPNKAPALQFFRDELQRLKEELKFQLIVIVNSLMTADMDSARIASERFIADLGATKVLNGPTELCPNNCTYYEPPNGGFVAYLIGRSTTNNGLNDGVFNMIRARAYSLTQSRAGTVGERIIKAIETTIRKMMPENDRPKDFGPQYFDIGYLSETTAKFHIKQREKFYFEPSSLTAASFSSQEPIPLGNGASMRLLRLPAPATACTKTSGRNESSIEVTCQLRSPCGVLTAGRADCPRKSFPTNYTTTIATKGAICDTKLAYYPGYGEGVVIQETVDNLCPDMPTPSMVTRPTSVAPAPTHAAISVPASLSVTALGPISYAHGAQLFPIPIPEPESCSTASRPDGSIVVTCNVRSPCQTIAAGKGCVEEKFPTILTATIALDGASCNRELFHLPGFGVFLMVQMTRNQTCPPLRTAWMAWNYFLIRHRSLLISIVTLASLLAPSIPLVLFTLRRLRRRPSTVTPALPGSALSTPVASAASSPSSTMSASPVVGSASTPGTVVASVSPPPPPCAAACGEETIIAKTLFPPGTENILGQNKPKREE